MQEWVSILKYLAVEMTSFFFGGGVLEGRLGLNYVLLKKYIDICYINDVTGSVGRKWRWITYPVEISLLGKSASGSLQPWSGSEAGGKTSGPDRSLGDVVTTESCFVFALLAYVSQHMQQQCISWEKPSLTYSQKCPYWILYPLKVQSYSQALAGPCRQGSASCGEQNPACCGVRLTLLLGHRVRPETWNLIPHQLFQKWFFLVCWLRTGLFIKDHWSV